MAIEQLLNSRVCFTPLAMIVGVCRVIGAEGPPYRQAWARVRTISNLINAMHGQQEIWLTGCRIAAPSEVIAPLKSGPCPMIDRCALSF